MSNVAEQVDVVRVRLTAERFVTDGFVELLPITLEVNIYSHINMPFLTGNVVIFDDNNLFEEANIQGTERLEFSYRNFLSKEVFTKRFIISDISSQKTNDAVGSVVLGLIEEPGFLSNVKVFSKSFSGTGSDIISKILLDQLDQEIEIQGEPAQHPFKYIVPYVTPFEAAGHILEKITTDSGLPFFLFKGYSSDKIKLKDMETILRADRASGDPAKRKFIYSQAHAASNKLEDQLYNINSFHESEGNEDTLSLAAQGAVGSLVNIIDITSGTVTPFNIDVLTIVDELIRTGVTTNPIGLVDKEFTPDTRIDTTLRGFQSKQFTQIVAENYPLTGLGYSQEALTTHYYLKVVRDAMLHHLYKNTYTISGPGGIVTTGSDEFDVGSQIEIEVQNNVMQPGNGNMTAAIDLKRSGSFIVTGQRIQFDLSDNGWLHKYSMDVSRITNLG